MKRNSQYSGHIKTENYYKKLYHHYSIFIGEAITTLKAVQYNLEEWHFYLILL